MCRKFGFLVLDPHDEYYCRHVKGLRQHPKAKENLLYYSTDAPKNQIPLPAPQDTLTGDAKVRLQEF